MNRLNHTSIKLFIAVFLTAFSLLVSTNYSYADDSLPVATSEAVQQDESNLVEVHAEDNAPLVSAENQAEPTAVLVKNLMASGSTPSFILALAVIITVKIMLLSIAPIIKQSRLS